jgi:predicted Zn-ribbon and HTH transcriptional regulator
MALRERLIKLLRETDRPLSTSEIIRLLWLSPRDKDLVYDALAHIAKTIRRRSGGREQLVMVPPMCLNCGYVFKDLERPRKPSRCPRCKSERISEPKFMIVEK